MRKQLAKKITWTIKNFSFLQSTEVYSDKFVVGGCKWHLSAYPKGNGKDVDVSLSLYLGVDNPESLPSGWRRHTQFRLTLVNQNSGKNSQLKECKHWYEANSTSFGYSSMLPLKELYAKDGGFLVNNQVKILAEVDVLEVIGKLDETEETSTLTETMVVNGFELLPSQAQSVSRMFERYPDIASEFLPMNPTLRIAYMSFLHNLVETMCQSPHELSKDDLSSASAALEFMTKAGFKLDWLEKKLNEVLAKKENEQVGETRLQGIEKQLKDLKRKCSDMEALAEMEKAKVLAAKAPLSFDNVV